MKFVRVVVLAAITVAASVGFNVRSAAATDAPVYGIPEIADPSGPYVGVFAGWGWGDSKVGAVKTDVDGLNGGALIGWELRRDNYLVGVEGDFAAAAIDGANGPGATRVDVNWLGSLRLRGGFNIDGISAYGTGGIAFANMDAAITTAAPPSDTATLTGFVVGAGIAAPLGENVAARLEYLYYDFNSSNYMIGGVAVRGDLHLHTVRAALIYNFNLM
jgi:outer membrane immunogenic protein